MSQKFQVVTVYDKKMLVYFCPSYYVTKGQALREFEDKVNDANSPFNRHPEDYALYLIGEYEDTTGKLTPCPVPLYLEDALAVVKNGVSANGKNN